MYLTKILAKVSQPHNHTIDYERIVPRFVTGDSIPHRIMQTCKSVNGLPEAIVRNISHIKAMNAGWEYCLFDNARIEDWINKSYGSVILGYYKRISPSYGAAKADLFRYLYIYKKGGVYLDIKSSMSSPVESHLHNDDSFILSYWDNLEGEGHAGIGHYSNIFDEFPRGEIPQWFIISAAGHPIIRDVIIQVLKNIDNYNPYITGIGWTGTVFTTGPVPYSLTIYKNVSKYPHRIVNAFTEFGFVYSIYENSHSDRTFHATAIKSDYRKCSEPLIEHRNALVQYVNRWYLTLLSKHHGR